MDKKAQLSEVLNEICNESDKRLYGKYWDNKYNSVNDFLEDKTYSNKEDIGGYLPYFVTKYYKSKDYENKEVFKSTFNEYVIFDNLFIDFDADEDTGRTSRDSINEAIRVSKGLKSKGLDVLLNYSGSKGGHIHILFNPVKLNNPDEVLNLFCTKIDATYKVTTDSQVYNKLNGLMRVPCSIHNKTGYYGHFIDFEDDNSVNDLFNNNIETSPSEIIKSKAKYYIPSIPDRDKNTKIIEPILKELDELIETSKTKNINHDGNIDYEFKADTNFSTNENEFMTHFKPLYYKGNRWNIGHALIFMLKRSRFDDEKIKEIFKQITPDEDMAGVKNWIAWINNMDKTKKFAGLHYFENKIKESIRNKTNLHGEDIDKTIEETINYFRNVFKHDNSIYKPPSKLNKKKYKHDENRFYCSLEPSNNYYLSIERSKNYYLYCIGEFKENTFNKLTEDYSGKKPITINDEKRNGFLERNSKRIMKKHETDALKDIIGILEDIAIDLGNTDDYKQITAEFSVYKENIVKRVEDDDEENDKTKTFNEYPVKIQEEAIKLIENSKLYDNNIKTVELTHANDEALIKTLSLITSSIYIGDPIHTIVGGDSGIGKTDLTEKIGNNFPDNHVFHIRDISPKNIFYAKDEFNKDYNILIFDDVDLSKKEFIEVIKTLADNKKPIKELRTVIDQKAVTFTLESKFLVILTFAKSIPDEELFNRLFNTGIIVDKKGETEVKHKIKINTQTDIDNNLLIKQLEEINKCAITKLVENNYKFFNPYTLFFNPKDFNNRDIPAFMNLVNVHAFYHVHKRDKVKIKNKTVVIGNLEDLKAIYDLWDIETQKNKINTRQRKILKLDIPELTLDEAMAQQKNVYNEYINADSTGFKKKLKEKQWTLKRISKEIEENKKTIKKELDGTQEDRNTKNLYEMGLIERYFFEDDNPRSGYVYYKPKNENEKNPSKLNNDNGYMDIIKKYQQKNYLEVKISIIINLLYRYNILINKTSMVYIISYCINYNKNIESNMGGFITGFFEQYNDLLIPTDSEISVIEIMDNMEFIKPFLNPLQFDENINKINDIYTECGFSTCLISMPKTKEYNLNHEQTKKTLIQSNYIHDININLKNKEILKDLDNVDKKILENIIGMLPKGSALTKNEIIKNYPTKYDEPDEHQILRLEKSIDLFIKKQLLRRKNIDGLIKFEIVYQ